MMLQGSTFFGTSEVRADEAGQNYTGMHVLDYKFDQETGSVTPTPPKCDFDPENNEVETADEQERPRFDVFLLDASYFSGKLETYLRYKRISYRRIEITHRLFTGLLFDRTGLAEVPMLYDRHKRVYLRDTTSIINLFEANPEEYGITRSRQVHLAHDQALNFVTLLFEDYGDTFLWTPAMYYRWNFRLDAGNVSRKFVFQDFLRGPKFNIIPSWINQMMIIDRQYTEYVTHAGIVDDAGCAYMEGLYKQVLTVLEDHFRSTKHNFLFGSQPTMADFGFMGSMFRHFFSDPTPTRLGRLYGPSVYEWVARMWNGSGKICPNLDSSLETCAFPQALLKSIVNEFLHYLVKNAEAIVDQKESFQFGPLRPKPIAFRAWTALNLIKQWESMDLVSGQQRVTKFLKTLDLDITFFLEKKQLFAKAANQWHGLKDAEPPFCSSPKPKSKNLLVTLYGTPHHDLKPPMPTRMSGVILGSLLIAILAIKRGGEARKLAFWSILTLYGFIKFRSKYL